jgi:hypothetical protein
MLTDDDLKKIGALLNARMAESDQRQDARFKEVDARFNEAQVAIDARFKEVDARFKEAELGMDARFKQVDARFEKSDARQDALAAQLDGMEARLETRLGQTLARHFGAFEESINHKLDLLAEGHTMLAEKVERVEARIDQVEAQLTRKIDAVAADLADHRRDTEAHRKGWRVGEGE